uniref:UTP--glucose-1-phosphate uridylyltransferase n=1 Tax=Setaria digitata TaxID=48799 RepID=A0A915PW90_9BILA
MSSQEVDQFLSDDVRKLFRNISDRFKELFVNDKRTEFDAEIFLSLFKQYLTESATIDWNKMKPLSLEFQQDYDSLPDSSGIEERGEIAKHLSVVKLNGGLGTTMGCDGPKSLIELRNEMTFLDFAIGHVQGKDCFIDAFFSGTVEGESRKLVQCILFHILIWYPPGHGNVFKSMHFTGVLDELLAQGRDICFISNIDNTGATIDLRIAKFMLEKDLEYVMECTEKTEVDRKGGTLIEINGYIMHLEMPQVPKDHVDDFCSTDIFKIFNTNNIWVNLKAVKKKLAGMKMEIIVNRKFLSNGEPVNQLETSVGGAIRNFDKVLSVKVPRFRFLPVKNAGDLLAIMSDLYEVTENSSLHFVRTEKAPPVIQLSDHFNKISEFRKRFCEIPRLKQLKRLKIVGDVYFGHNIILKGNVEIISDKGQQLKVPDGECLENVKLIQTAQSEIQKMPLQY